MKKNTNLLEGPIFPALTGLALPIMGASLIQMAYNMIDMIWIGRVGSGAVAAIGAAGMYMWLANGLVTMAKVGGQVKVGHALGSGEKDLAAEYIKSALQLGIFMSLLFGAASIFGSDLLISFFKLNSPQVVEEACVYLQVTCGLVLFSFVNQIFTGVFTAMGNSKITLLATAAGLVINMILDPVLIFGWGPFPYMGVLGAAVATVFAQAIVTGTFLVCCLREGDIFRRVSIFSKVNGKRMGEMTRIGIPMAVQSMIFTGISMVISRMVAGFGDAAVAVQKVGSQIESISWMAAEGFGAAVNAFMAQNFGAGNKVRMNQGYKAAMKIVLVWGLLCTVLLMGLPEVIFQIFIPDPEILPMGVDYLKILGVSQLFMCVEITTQGAFSGLGKTMPPAAEGILLTAARIPMAMFLLSTALGLNGIWWSITISSIFKGIVLFLWFLLYMKKMNHRKPA